MQWYRDARQRLEALYDEYGKTALGIFVVMAVSTFIAFWIAIKNGLDATHWLEVLGLSNWIGEDMSTFGLTYALYRLTFPIRVIITVAITPPIAHRLGKTPKPRQVKLED